MLPDFFALYWELYPRDCDFRYESKDIARVLLLDTQPAPQY